MRVYALIAAAGVGSRLGADIPKAYVALRGRPLVVRSVQAMITSEVVDEVIVIISPQMHDYAHKLLHHYGLFDAEIPVRLVHGGQERADSVWCGLQCVPDKEAVVLIHDAARALTPPGMIARVARGVLEGKNAVIPVLPVADTIKKVVDNQVVETPVRSALKAVQTPQGFKLSVLKAANEAYFANNPDFIATDDASLVEWAGEIVSCVPGDPMAFKITTLIDYALAKAVTDKAEPTIFEVPDV
ncbi:4-diphosphocytidyl-2C-methyl-D-erythritol synthase [Corynebacterium kutscheri]|uniref:2-C-methyl-D-erythritol 4-phosphate cytidylyltransferase n=1 Tax=Corynebacterium kutscheri TaxID=35755 RepID=A0A0F6QYS6_9CORY|nr:2-C-methyl-D-erythritol 4-phosphate cytidylyltransferase [Corynebacterium kutscheri]VEH04561.1 4-diphosphocytidyl-2C-methyl-D-erythritol synthase [Corynebacterium kutscheri]VEH11155.1 4-diphosphocytidyl-2C-methyl-D-erythritol synthase [Corynebacterium kutscheri]VEH80368.1 4-diphosphocytidyl-2C-methyl-D-erythritol synthase [Corynebacterium kutscheri]